jgi:hypothetical protein
LLVARDFRDQDGNEWRSGDRAPTARAAVRAAAFQDPSRFLIEFETLPLTQASSAFDRRVKHSIE